MSSVLVVSPRFPLPLRSGTQIRTFHALEALNERFDVTLVSLVQGGEGTDHVSDLESRGIDVETVAHSRSKRGALRRFVTSQRPYRVCKFGTDPFRRAVRRTLSERQFEFAWVNFLSSVPLVPADGPPVVLDEHNSDVRYWESFREGSLPKSVFARENVRRIRRLRRRVRDRVDVVLSVSEADAAATREWTDAPVAVVPNGVDVEQFSPTTAVEDADPRVLFVGSLDVTMNVEAVRWFIEESWPAIHEARPEATFDLVGRSPTAAVRELADRPGVKLHADVPEVVPFYDRASVVVAPFQHGGGTKLKVLEALAMERAVVTTETGAVGIDLDDGEHAVVAPRDEAFASAVVDLLADPQRRQVLGTAGRRFVEERFAWDSVMDRGVDVAVSHVDSVT